MYCFHCGAQQPDNHRFCTVCGTDLQSTQPLPSGNEAAPRKGSHWVPVLILIILSILGTALYFVTAGKAVPAAASQTPWFSVVNGQLFFDESKYTGSSEVTVPSQINGQTVTALGSGCFMDCKNVTGVHLPDSVTDIGEMAFYECSALRGIYIPNNVTRIGSEAFYGCPKLEAVYLNQGLTAIGTDAFDECNRLLYIFYSGTHQEWTALYDEVINPFSTVFCKDGSFYQGAPVTP